MFYLFLFPVCYLFPAAGVLSKVSSYLLPVSSYSLNKPAGVKYYTAVVKGTGHEYGFTKVHRCSPRPVVFTGFDFHHQTGFYLPGNLVVGDGKLPYQLILHTGTVGYPERDLSYSIFPTGTQAQRNFISFYFEAALDVLER